MESSFHHSPMPRGSKPTPPIALRTPSLSFSDSERFFNQIIQHNATPGRRRRSSDRCTISAWVKVDHQPSQSRTPPLNHQPSTINHLAASQIDHILDTEIVSISIPSTVHYILRYNDYYHVRTDHDHTVFATTNKKESLSSWPIRDALCALCAIQQLEIDCLITCWAMVWVEARRWSTAVTVACRMASWNDKEASQDVRSTHQSD